MYEVISLIALVVVVLAILINSDLVLGYLGQKIIEPGTKWFLKFFHGIDTPRTGTEAMIGRVLRLESDFSENNDDQNSFVGSILIDGERWIAISDSKLVAGTEAAVIGVKNLKVVVEACNHDEAR